MKIFFAIATMILFFAVSAKSQSFAITPADSDIAITNQFSDAEIQGYKLARQILEQFPTKNFLQTGTMVIRDSNKKISFPLRFDVQVSGDYGSWNCIYDAFINGTNIILEQESLNIWHQLNRYNHYWYNTYNALDTNSEPKSIRLDLYRDQSMIPFANSDFWLCDLGLEFFHWPAQKVLPKTTNLKRGREYTLLESTNPNPATNGYSRVLSWIDKETGGILEAEAYDFNGKLLKDFAPKSFKKVNGQWELQEMEIRNVQTGSRTRLEFDLKK